MKETNEQITELLRIRRQIKKKKPVFIRQQAYHKKCLEIKWRKPKGLHSKMRLHKSGHRKCVTKGYKSPLKVRGLSREGLMPTLVSNVSQLTALSRDKHIIIISSNVGMKKRIEIVKKALSSGLKISNIKEPQQFIEEKEKEFRERIEKKKGEKKKGKEAKKEEKTIEKIAKEESKKAELTQEEKKELEKKEMDKLLTQRGSGY